VVQLLAALESIRVASRYICPIYNVPNSLEVVRPHILVLHSDSHCGDQFKFNKKDTEEMNQLISSVVTRS
jgi:hypothetical protein